MNVSKPKNTVSSPIQCVLKMKNAKSAIKGECGGVATPNDESNELFPPFLEHFHNILIFRSSGDVLLLHQYIGLNNDMIMLNISIELLLHEFQSKRGEHVDLAFILIFWFVFFQSHFFGWFCFRPVFQQVLVLVQFCSKLVGWSCFGPSFLVSLVLVPFCSLTRFGAALI